jgi:hypothetical protein
MDMGTEFTDSERFCAVTTISSRAPADSGDVCCAWLEAHIRITDAENTGANAQGLRMVYSPLLALQILIFEPAPGGSRGSNSRVERQLPYSTGRSLAAGKGANFVF